MAFTHVFTRACRDSSGVPITSTESIVNDSELNFDGTVAASSTNVEIDWTVTVANLKSIAINCDQPVTIKTNSSGSPQETITLIAGQVMIWTLATDGAGHVPFAGDVTKLFVTNVTTSIASFKIRALAHQHT